MAIHVYLDDVLRSRGMTAKELCAKVGITEANLSILRSGKAKGVRFGTINRICYYLDCDVGDILKFDGNLEAEDEKEGLLAKINDIDLHLNEVDKNLKDIDYREANKRAGYVYIISNIGSFGKDIYKIGMTRRLDPQDRVDELGDASVPFAFDVHAMIFSDDAPTLENNLHKEFDDKKVNMVNGRKEFFHVTLEEIKEAVKKYNENIIEIKDTPDAEQYRESLLIRKKLENQ